MLLAHPLEWHTDTLWGSFGVHTDSSHGSTLLLGQTQLWIPCEFETAKIILIAGSLLILIVAIFLVIWIMVAIWKKVMRGSLDKV